MSLFEILTLSLSFKYVWIFKKSKRVSSRQMKSHQLGATSLIRQSHQKSHSLLLEIKMLLWKETYKVQDIIKD